MASTVSVDCVQDQKMGPMSLHLWLDEKKIIYAEIAARDRRQLRR